MTKAKKHLFILVVIITTSMNMFCFSQIDSLKNQLKITKTDTGKAKIYFLLAGKLLHENTAESFAYVYKGLAISKQQHFEKGIAEAFFVLGNLHSFNSDDSSLYYLNRSLELKQKLKDFAGVASLYTSIGTCYYKYGNSELALKNYLKSLKFFDSLNIDKGIAGAALGAGNVLVNINSFKQSIEYYQKSIESYRKINSPYESWAINNLAIVYEKLNDFQKARELYEESLELKTKNNDFYAAGFTIDNIGMLLVREKKYNEAQKYFYKALKLNRDYKLEKETFANSYKNIVTVLLKMNDSNTAKLYLDSLEITIKDLNMAELTLEYVSLKCSYYENIKDYKKALEFNKKYIALKDSFSTKDLNKQVSEAEAKYKSEKKQKEIELLNKDHVIQQIKIDKQQTQRNLFIIGFVFLIFLSAYIYKSFLQKQKANILIIEQKNQVEVKNHIIEEKHKEITDSINYAERIQRSFLASKELLNENLKEYFVFFQPKDVVSGDFYWANKLSNENFALVIADSTGHGVPGAIMSLLNITSIESAIKDGNISPADILNHTRKTIIERLKRDGSAEGGKDGMDCSLICFDFKNSRFTYSAANNPVWIVRENQLIELAPDKMPVGKHDKDQNPFTQNEFQVQKGDVVYALTDGLPDQFGGPKGKKFMYKQLKKLLISISLLPMDIQKQKLNEVLIEWKGNLEQVDDVCIVGIRI